jgi:hypothetical protein
VSSIAYDCHVMFIPGTMSLDWDIVAFGGVGPGTSVVAMEERIAALEVEVAALKARLG